LSKKSSFFGELSKKSSFCWRPDSGPELGDGLAEMVDI